MRRPVLFQFSVAFVVCAIAIGLLAQPVAAGQPQPEGAAGRRVVHGITFDSFADVVAYGVEHHPSRKVLRPPEEETEDFERAKERANDGRSKPSNKPTVEPFGAAGSPGGSVIPAAPTLGRTFAGMTGGGPPDSNLAVGPHNLVSVANSGVMILAKNGTVLSPTPTPTLTQFFASLSPVGPFDPRAVFDPTIGRFWVVAGDVLNPAGSSPGVAQLLIALSATNDATGAWTFFALNARLDGTTLVNRWCDYPTFGFDADAVFFSCNMFNFPAARGTTGGSFQGVKVRTMTKSQFVTNSCCLWWDDWNLHEGFLGIDPSFTIQPAVMLDGGTTEFLVNAHGHGFSDHVLEVRRITNAGVCCVPGSQAQPTWHSHDLSVGSFPVAPNALQVGPDSVATGDTRLLYAFVQGDKLSTGQNTACNDGSGGLDACVTFTEIDVSAYPNGMVPLNDWVSHPANGTDTYFPVVAPNASGARTMAYTRSGGGQNPSAMFLGVPAASTCLSCVNGPETSFLAGTAAVSCGTSPCTASWGDYHGAAPDPDGAGVWVSAQGMGTISGTTRRVSQVALTSEAGDFTPPVTTASLNPPVSDNGWVMGKPVAVTLTSTDAGVGPWKITYKVVNGPVTIIPTTTVTAASTSLQLQSAGMYDVTFHGTDNWGNVEADQTLTVRVDADVQKILFASTRDGNPSGGHELYAMDPDGSHQVRLTNNGADDTQPVADHSGRVYFTSNRDGDYEIYRLDPNGAIIALTDNTATDWEPSVRPDGSRVAFSSDRSGDFEIYTMDAGGGSLSPPVNPTTEQDVEPDWLVDTTRLAYVHDDPFGDPRDPYLDFNIFLTNPGGFFGTIAEERRPAWRPDGAKVAAYMDGDIFTFNVPDTNHYSFLTSGPEIDDSPTWSPHGGWLAFSTDRTGNAEIYRMDDTGGALTNLTNRGGQDVQPEWVTLGQGFGLGVELPIATIQTRAGFGFPLKIHLDPHAPYTLLESRVIVHLPPGVTVGDPSVPGGDCGVDTERVVCSFGGLEAGAERDLTMDVKAGIPGIYPLMAETDSGNADPFSDLQMLHVLPETPPTGDVDVSDAGFAPVGLPADQGTAVTWHFLGPRKQTVTDRSGIGLFDSGPHARGTTFTFSFAGAGTYPYRSELHPELKGRVAIPVEIQPAGPDGDLAVAWSSAKPRKGQVFDVQVRFRAASGGWSDWVGWCEDDCLTAGLFQPDRGPGEYAFRARLRKINTGAVTGWSPEVIARVE